MPHGPVPGRGPVVGDHWSTVHFQSLYRFIFLHLCHTHGSVSVCEMCVFVSVWLFKCVCLYGCFNVCVCVCVCLCERERECKCVSVCVWPWGVGVGGGGVGVWGGGCGCAWVCVG